MVRTMLRLMQTDPGFDRRNLLTLTIELDDHWRLEKRLDVFQTIVERLRALPGVEHAGLTVSLPIDGSRWNTGFIVGDKAVPPRTELPSAAFTPVSTGYFETMKMQLLRGRLFDRRESPSSARVAVVNETLARKLWPGEDPIGKRLKHGWPEDPRPWRTVIGVVADVKTDGIERNTPMQIYVPIVREPSGECIVVMRGERLEQMTAAISATLRELDKDMPIYAVATMDHVMAEEIVRQRVSMVVLSVFGGVALLLAMIGLYGVMSHGVTERTQEIGLRMALGATGGEVLRLFLQQGLFAAGCGIALGVAVALGLTRGLETLLFGVTATDALTFAVVGGGLLVVALAACYIPARRAAHVDPLVALRWE
jgi:putative ABC transport system permease protein